MNGPRTTARSPRWPEYSGDADRNAIFVVLLATIAFALGLRFFDSRLVWLMIALASSLSLVLVWQTAGSWRRREDLPWFGPKPAVDVVSGLAGGIVLVLLTHLLFPFLSTQLGIVDNVRRLYLPLDAPPGRLGALPIVCAAVVAEELVWRGVAVWRLQRSVSLASGPLLVMAASALYCLPQVASGSWVLAAVAFGCGLVWTCHRVWAGSMVPALINHLVWSLSIIAIWPLPVGQ